MRQTELKLSPQDRATVEAVRGKGVHRSREVNRAHVLACLDKAIPVIDNGPVTTINNSLAVAFGLDWAHFGDSCDLPGVADDDCSANDFWFPVVAQWNFYFTKVVSAFPELGLAIQHSSWDSEYCRQGNGNYVRCDDGGSDTDVELVMWLGVRFQLQDTFALTLRLGTPSLLLGASFNL